MVMQHEFRKDYFTDIWVLYAPAKQYSPSKLKIVSDKDCYLCGKEKVIDNPYPCVHPSKFKIEGKGSLYTTATGHGYDEIIIITPEHGVAFHDLSVDDIVDVFRMFIDRQNVLKRRERIEHVLFLLNNGPLVSNVNHAHVNVVAFPKVPADLARELNGYDKYFKKNRECVFCKIIHDENKKSRFIKGNSEFVSIAPYASRYPFEFWILPKKHVKRLSDLNDQSLFYLSEMLKSLLVKLNKRVPEISYSIVVHEAPTAQEMRDFHMHVEVHPVMINTYNVDGTYVNHVFPEKAADVLR